MISPPSFAVDALVDHGHSLHPASELARHIFRQDWTNLDLIAWKPYSMRLWRKGWLAGCGRHRPREASMSEKKASI